MGRVWTPLTIVAAGMLMVACGRQGASASPEQPGAAAQVAQTGDEGRGPADAEPRDESEASGEPGQDEGQDEGEDEGEGETSPDSVDLPAPAGADVTKITFDADEPNPGPTEHVVGRPKRPNHGSMLTPDVLAGPK